jgi:hypothetical protein
MKKDLLTLIVAMLIVSPFILALNGSERILPNIVGISYCALLILVTKYTKIGKQGIINVYRSSLRVENYLYNKFSF